MLHKEIFSFVNRTLNDETSLRTEKGQDFILSLSKKLFGYEESKPVSKRIDFDKFSEKVQASIESLPGHRITWGTVSGVQARFTGIHKVYDPKIFPELDVVFTRFIDIANNLKLIATSIEEEYSHTTLAIVTNMYLVEIGFSLIPLNFCTFSLKDFYSNTSVELIRDLLIAESFYQLSSNFISEMNIKGTLSEISGIGISDNNDSNRKDSNRTPHDNINLLTFD